MIIQISISGYEWIIGLGLMVGLAFFFTILVKGDFKVFMVFLTVFNGFIVWANLLELWTLILNLIITAIIFLRQIKANRG